MERRAIQLRWQLFSGPRDDLPADAGAAAAHSDSGGWRLAAQGAVAAGGALRWLLSLQASRGWGMERLDSRRGTRAQSVYREPSSRRGSGQTLRDQAGWTKPLRRLGAGSRPDASVGGGGRHLVGGVCTRGRA